MGSGNLKTPEPAGLTRKVYPGLGGSPLDEWPDVPSLELSEIKQCTSTKDKLGLKYRLESRLEGSQHRAEDPTEVIQVSSWATGKCLLV